MIKVTDYTMEAVNKKSVIPFIEKWHYSDYVAGIQHKQCFALYSPDGKFGLPRMIGAMIYGQPAMSNTAKRYNSDKMIQLVLDVLNRHNIDWERWGHGTIKIL